MIFYPAIDLKDGACVRVKQGGLSSAKIYNENPVLQAMTFQNAGCQWLHVVDLQGAVDGKPRHTQVIKDILAATNLSVQVGGGIRTFQAAKEWIDAGAERIIVGTVAIKDPDLLDEMANAWPNQVVVALDSRGGYVATDGWVKQSKILAIDAAKALSSLPLAAFIYTDINRDGMGQGVNVEATVTLANAVNVPIIASGGVNSEDDLRRLFNAKTSNINGVISGHAIYEGKVDVNRCVQILAGREPC